jgi:peptidoglycan/xylan/chitin deacetylase (PgdA/CDA1 family)
VSATITDRIRRKLAGHAHPGSIRERRSTGMVSVTFDDFAKTAWTEGGAVLRDHGVRGTYYTAGGLCGTRFDDQVMYDTDDLEALHAAGHEIGCHTFEHQSCLRRGTAALDESLARNQAFVRERLGDVRLVSFAYPYGDATVAAQRLAVRRFASARGVNPGLSAGRLRVSQLPSVGLEGGDERLDRVDELIDQAAREGAWLILVGHDVSDRPGPFGCRQADLDRALRSARDAGLEILTVKGALARRRFAA